MFTFPDYLFVLQVFGSEFQVDALHDISWDWGEIYWPLIPFSLLLVFHKHGPFYFLFFPIHKALLINVLFHRQLISEVALLSCWSAFWTLWWILSGFMGLNRQNFLTVVPNCYLVFILGCSSLLSKRVRDWKQALPLKTNASSASAVSISVVIRLRSPHINIHLPILQKFLFPASILVITELLYGFNEKLQHNHCILCLWLCLERLELFLPIVRNTFHESWTAWGLTICPMG